MPNSTPHQSEAALVAAVKEAAALAAAAGSATALPQRTCAVFQRSRMNGNTLVTAAFSGRM